MLTSIRLGQTIIIDKIKRSNQILKRTAYTTPVKTERPNACWNYASYDRISCTVFCVYVTVYRSSGSAPNSDSFRTRTAVRRRKQKRKKENRRPTEPRAIGVATRSPCARTCASSGTRLAYPLYVALYRARIRVLP